MRRLPAKYEPPAISQSAEETNDPLIADARNFYKVEKWTFSHLSDRGRFQCVMNFAAFHAK